MAMFGKSKEEELLEVVMEQNELLKVQIDELRKTVEAIKEVDTVAIIKSVQASFNGIRASNENSVNRLFGIVKSEFDKRLGEVKKVPVVRDEKEVQAMEDRKTRPIQEVYLGDDDE